MNENTNAIATTETKAAVMSNDFAASMEDSKTVFCSFTPATVEEKKALFNAMNSPEFRVAAFINKRIPVKNILVETVNCTSQDTGELVPTPRVVLFDKDGHTYQCVSFGVYTAVKKMIACFGMPATWDKPITVEVKQIPKKDRSLLTLEVV